MLETPIVIYEDIASRAGISQDGKCFIILNPDIYDADACTHSYNNHRTQPEV